MAASLPLKPKPLTVTGLLLPTLASAKAALGVPLTLTESVASGVTVGVPLSVALVLASYTLLLAVTPVMARWAGVMCATVASPVARL